MTDPRLNGCDVRIVDPAPSHFSDVNDHIIPTSLIFHTLRPHYVIPAEAGIQVTYPLGIVEFFQ
jgi:hypothetical protein